MRVLIVGAAVVFALVGAGAAEHCSSWTTSEAHLAAGGFYVVNEACQPSCTLVAFVYEETNDLPGLQRGDHRHDDTCHGMIVSDTLPGA